MSFFCGSDVDSGAIIKRKYIPHLNIQFVEGELPQFSNFCALLFSV